jgi:hypothetical protein
MSPPQERKKTQFVCILGVKKRGNVQEEEQKDKEIGSKGATFFLSMVRGCF